MKIADFIDSQALVLVPDSDEGPAPFPPDLTGDHLADPEDEFYSNAEETIWVALFGNGEHFAVMASGLGIDRLEGTIGEDYPELK